MSVMRTPSRWSSSCWCAEEEEEEEDGARKRVSTSYTIEVGSPQCSQCSQCSQCYVEFGVKSNPEVLCVNGEPNFISLSVPWYM